MHIVEGFLEVDEIDVPLDVLFDDVRQIKDQIYASPAFSQSCLFLPDRGINDCIESDKKNPAENLELN